MSFFETARLALNVLRESRMSRARPEAVRAVQDRRLRKLLRFAVTRSSFYREKFAGLDLERAPLDRFPVTTKAEIAERFDDVVTDPAVRRIDVEAWFRDPENVERTFLGRYPVCHTSGSLGQSLPIVQDSSGIELLCGFQATRGNTHFRVGPVEAVRRLLRPARIAILINRPGFFPSAWVFRQISPSMRKFVRIRFFSSIDPTLESSLNEFKPTTLVGNPSTLDLLAFRAERLDLTHLEQVSTSSETLTDAIRSRLKRAYGAPIIDNYAMGECLFLTNGCRAETGTHVNADWAILENVDDDYRPVEPGRVGSRVLLTNLSNYVQPFIRYEIGDRIVQATEDCGCGNRLPRIERVEGRTADFFWVRRGTEYLSLTNYPFQHVLEYFREIREWQVVQTERNRFVLCVEPLPRRNVDADAVRNAMLNRFREIGLAEALTIDVRLVGELSWDPRTGKYRRLVTQVGPPADLPAGRPQGAVVLKSQDTASPILRVDGNALLPPTSANRT